MRNKLGANDTRLPVTLLTGFLGAGKTTLLNAIIAQSTGPKIAVIVNDFGEVGLDHDLIDTVDEEVALMKSGCLCCSIREDLARVLQSLTARCLAAKLVAPNLGARQVAQGPCLWGYRRPLTKTRHEGPVACCRVPCRHYRPDRRLE